MSQVKNLRAMFENKGDDSSPPDRGRSPGPSGSTTPGASFTGSPRPLSRIRSSFVAIEKDGRMGLQRTNSDESSIARRRMSGDTDAESVSAMSDNKSVTTPGEEPTKTARRMFINDPIPESPRLPKDLEGSSHDIGAVTDEPSVNPDKQTDEEQPSKNMLPADPTIAEVNKDSSKPVAGTAVANGKPKADSAKSTGAAAVKKTTARPSAISTKPAAKTAPPTKASATVKTPTSASSTATAKPAVKATARPAAKTTAASTRPTASTVTKPTASSATKKPATLKPSTSGTGFVKPKVKSPTKPVNLPPSLMAQTAASGAKGSSARQSLTAQSGNTLARSSSRASTTTGGSKYPKAPVSKNPRPSIGPPPKKTEPQRPATRDSNVDEGFLARMMRPTASSAQKTAEKTTLTPPKRTASRPSTTTSRRESSVRSLSRTKTPSVHASEPADDAKDKTASINEEEPDETAAGAGSGLDADLAHSAEEAQSLVVEEGATEVADEAAVGSEAAPAAEPLVETKANIEAVDDVVLETAVVETAEEAKEVAEEVDEVLSPAKTDEPAQASVNAEAAEVEDAAIEAANLETAEEAAAVADEAGLVQTPVEPEIDQQELSKEDELAVDAANVETVEDAAAIAAGADLVQTSVEPADHTDETESKEAAQSNEAPEVTTDKGADLVTDESKQFSPVSPAESDIDLLTEKLAETRIEAGDEKPVDEEAKQTR